MEEVKEEMKQEKKKTDDVKEEERQTRVRLMEKTAEYTHRMNELLNIKDERDEAFKTADQAEKRLREIKKVVSQVQLVQI